MIVEFQIHTQGDDEQEVLAEMNVVSSRIIALLQMEDLSFPHWEHTHEKVKGKNGKFHGEMTVRRR